MNAHDGPSEHVRICRCSYNAGSEGWPHEHRPTCLYRALEGAEVLDITFVTPEQWARIQELKRLPRKPLPGRPLPTEPS